ncbi:hypothetical protein J502_0924 [Acinetobacter sp. 1294596]|nr:hypothetical protein J502_0924 [Acinetobacter sp. 1294596]
MKVWKYALFREKCFLCLGDMKKERADQCMFDENFNPVTLDEFRLK